MNNIFSAYDVGGRLRHFKLMGTTCSRLLTRSHTNLSSSEITGDSSTSKKLSNRNPLYFLVQG
jgi:hypothetical protein